MTIHTLRTNESKQTLEIVGKTLPLLYAGY